MGEKLIKYAELKGISSKSEAKDIMKEEKKDKSLKTADYNELTVKMAKDLGYL